MGRGSSGAGTSRYNAAIRTVSEGARLENEAYREYQYWGNGRHNYAQGTVTLPDGRVVTEEEQNTQLRRIADNRNRGQDLVASVIGEDGRLRLATRQSTLGEEVRRVLRRRG